MVERWAAKQVNCEPRSETETPVPGSPPSGTESFDKDSIFWIFEIRGPQSEFQWSSNMSQWSEVPWGIGQLVARLAQCFPPFPPFPPFPVITCLRCHGDAHEECWGRIPSKGRSGWHFAHLVIHFCLKILKGVIPFPTISQCCLCQERMERLESKFKFEVKDRLRCQAGYEVKSSGQI